MSTLPNATELQTMYLDGARVADLAAKYGVGVGVIYSRLYSVNTPMRSVGRPGKHDPCAVDLEVVRLRQDGMKVQDIANRYGVSHQRISQRIAKARQRIEGSSVWSRADIQHYPEA